MVEGTLIIMLLIGLAAAAFMVSLLLCILGLTALCLQACLWIALRTLTGRSRGPLLNRTARDGSETSTGSIMSRARAQDGHERFLDVQMRHG